MKDQFTYNDVPIEVMEVWAIQMGSRGIGVGGETYEYCQNIINRYPKWFEWEHKYDKIPQSVHDEYRREVYSFDMPKCENNEGFTGIIPISLAPTDILDRMTKKPISLVEAIAGVFRTQIEQRKRNELAKAERKRIWDKHYSKYDLEFRD